MSLKITLHSEVSRVKAPKGNSQNLTKKIFRKTWQTGDTGGHRGHSIKTKMGEASYLHQLAENSYLISEIVPPSLNKPFWLFFFLGDLFFFPSKGCHICDIRTDLQTCEYMQCQNSVERILNIKSMEEKGRGVFF